MPGDKAPRQATLAFIFVTVALDMITFGMIAPVLPKLIGQFVANDASQTSKWLGVFATIWALMQFVFSPLLGVLSDRVGRRPVILLSNFGLAVDYVIMALAPNLSWLLFGRLVSGITSASVPTAMAYIADTTPPEKRAGAFGLISSAFGLGFIVGPAIGGLLGDSNERLPFWVAGAMSLLNAIYGLFVLPESLPRDKRGAFTWAKANPVGSLTLLRRHPSLFGLAGALFIGCIAQGVFTTYVLYVDYRYQWSSHSVGLSLAIVGVCQVLAGAILVRPLVKWFGDRSVMIAGLLFGSLGCGILGWAPTGLILALAIPVMNLWALAGPTAQSMMTPHVEANEQGQLQGAIGALRSVAGLVGPGLFSAVFAWAIRRDSGFYLPGAAFYLAGMLLLASIFVALPATRNVTTNAGDS